MLDRDKKYFLRILGNIETQLDHAIETNVESGDLSNDGRKDFDMIVLNIRMNYSKPIQDADARDNLLVAPEFVIDDNITLGNLQSQLRQTLDTISGIGAALLPIYKIVEDIRPPLCVVPNPVPDTYAVTIEQYVDRICNGEASLKRIVELIDKIFTSFNTQIYEVDEPFHDTWVVSVLAAEIRDQFWKAISGLCEHMPQDPNDFVAILRQMTVSLDMEVHKFLAQIKRHDELVKSIDK